MLIEKERDSGLSGWVDGCQLILPGALRMRFALRLMRVSVAETLSAQAGIGCMTMNAPDCAGGALG